MSIFSLRRSSRCHSNSASILPFCLVVELQLQLRIYVIVLAIQQLLLLWRLGVLCQFVAALAPCSLSNSFPEELSLPSLHHRLVLCRWSLLERAQLACLSPFYSRNMIPFYPPSNVLKISRVCHDIILEVAGRRDLTVEIKTVKEWVMHAEDADRFVDRHGRIILAGDATYRFPPAGRFSLNTGIQDAHNLTWKLAAVLKDQASRTLLSTDEVESKPVAKANTALSVANFDVALAVPTALGLDPSAARYSQGALVVEVERTTSGKSVSAHTRRRLEYVPSSQAGARLPHFPIDIRHHMAPSSSSKKSFSTLDLISESDIHLALLVGCNKSGCTWAEAALTAVKLSAVPVKVVIMWPWKVNITEGFSIQNWDFVNECGVIHAQVDQGWWELCGVPDVGAILIRPDEHVAWRSTTAPDNSCVQQLHAIFAKVFPAPASVTDALGSATFMKRY